MGEPKIAILGAGPVAAFVYRACIDFGMPDVDIDVYGMSQTKAPAGAFWFHDVPKYLKSELTAYDILIIPDGTKENYVRKQWGEAVDPESSSFPRDPKIAIGYKPDEVLPLLWEGASLRVTGEMPDERIRLMSFTGDYTVIFQTFPSEEAKDFYKSYMVRIPTLSYAMPDDFTRNEVHYIGDLGDTVRLSFLFGRCHYEYVRDHIFEAEMLEVGKVGSFMDIHPNAPSWDPKRSAGKNVYLIGRYATFQRHYLSHEAYQETLDVLRGKL